MSESIYVVAELWRGRISDATFEALAVGRELADGLGIPLKAVALGGEVGDVTAELGLADSILTIEHTALIEPLPQVYSEALVQLVPKSAVRAMIVPLTNLSLGIGTLIAAEWRSPAINFCKDVRVVGTDPQARCLLYGGKVETWVAITEPATLLGLWPGARPSDRGRMHRVVPVENALFAPPRSQGVRFLRYIDPLPGDIDITRYEALVAVGRGIGGQESIAMAEDLAASLGAAVCGSRPVIDQGWLPLSRQVGKSGHVVKPKLYVALGISGAPEHVEGMRNADLIVAVNTDPAAPIFNVAHFGIVADAQEVASALARSIRRQRETAHA